MREVSFHIQACEQVGPTCVTLIFIMEVAGLNLKSQHQLSWLGFCGFTQSCWANTRLVRVAGT